MVFGMPKAAIERGYVMRVTHLQDLPALLQAQCASSTAPDRGRDNNLEVRWTTNAGK